MNKIEFSLMHKCGIYLFTNLISGKRYIGSSGNLYNRLHEHLHNLNNNKSHNKYFQNSWNKYGEDNFIYGILEFCNEENQFEREQFYIDFMHPEYNLTQNVIANTGHTVNQETKNKISSTLKRKYELGEINAKVAKQNSRITYIYNIRTWKLEMVCDYLTQAIRILNGNPTSSGTYERIYYNRYIVSYEKFENVGDLQNYYYKNYFKGKYKHGSYIVTEENGAIKYHKNLEECARNTFSSASTLRKHTKASKDNPYLIKNKIKFYLVNEYIPLEMIAVPIEESSELLSGKIGESPLVKDNAEVNIESKDSISPYSIESEPR